MKLPTIKDSKGRDSATLMFCIIAFLTMNFAFLWQVMHSPPGTPVPLTEYGLAFVGIMAPAFGRDVLKKNEP